MSDDSRFFSVPEATEVQILSTEKLEDVIQEMTDLRGSEDNFDSESIDNAIRLCEKMDVCFDKLSSDEKLLVLQNYDFFSSSYQFSLFLKLMFRGGLSSKEITFRALSRKLKATHDVVQCILSTKILFENQSVEEEVQHELNTFLDSLINLFSTLIPPSIRNTAEDPKSVQWLQTVLAQNIPIFNEQEVPYSETIRLFTDLLYMVFGHEQLPIYFKWKDAYLRNWLIETLREEDRFGQSPTPVLSTAKAELYVEYINWTKIAKRLNANLRHQQTFDTETTVLAEKVLLDRLPSSILLEIVQKMRLRMKKTKDVPEVDLGVDDESLDEMALYGDMLDEIIEAEDEQTTSWLGKMVAKIKDVFSPKEEEPEETVEIRERQFPEGLLYTAHSEEQYFAKVFPADYPQDIPKQFSLFFTRLRINYYPAFEEAVLEILMVYENNDLSSIANTLRDLKLMDADRSFEFEEHCLLIPVGKNLLMLGNTYFQMTFKDYNKHPAPFAYFKWFQEGTTSQGGTSLRVDGKTYQEIPLYQIGSNKEVFEGFIQVLDSLPDDSYEKPHIQQCLQFFHESD